MKLKKGFQLRQLGDEWILIQEGKGAGDPDKMITLDEIAAFLWQKVKEMRVKEVAPQEMAEWLCEEYEVTREIAFEDTQLIVQDWIEIGIAE